MRELSKDLLKAILTAVEKHPNTRISKLIKCVESEKTRKNIVLLLIELAEHPEFGSNMSISLNYYLDMFENLREETSFSEAGLLLLNSAIIYGKRVDHVHLTVEKLILSLINSENEEQKRHETIPSTPSTILRKGKKRPLEELCEPYEADMSIKRFKTLSNCKRFDVKCLNSTKKSSWAFMESRMKDSVVSLSKEFYHPTIWKYSVIEDYDYDDEIDSKKNYKLFTYHLEHRYNTLIPDINFKMYFKVKDFIDSECRDSTNSELWPPLSDAYIEQYVNLENQILYKDGHDTINQNIAQESVNYNTDAIHIRVHDELPHISSILRDLQIPDDNFEDPRTSHERIDLQICESINLNENSGYDQTLQHIDVIKDSALSLESGYNSLLTVSTDSSEQEDVLNKDSRIGSSSLQDKTSIRIESIDTPQLPEQTKKVGPAIECEVTLEHRSEENKIGTELIINDIIPDEALCKKDYDPTLLNTSYKMDDLTTIKVILPHLDDEGVFFSDLDERDQQMLSPAVVATDVFRCVKDKSNIIVIVDDVIKKIHNIQEPRQQVLSLPVFTCPEYPSLPLNILKIHHKYFKKRRTFKLGSEFHLLKKERHKKYSRETKHPTHPRIRVRLCEDVTGVPLSPPSSPNYEPDFFGFPEDGHSDKNRTLSRDSGISLQQIENPSDKEINDDFKECKYLLHSTLRSTNAECLLEFEGSEDNQQIANTLNGIESNKFPEKSKTIEKSTQNEITASNDILDEQSEPNLESTITENIPSVMSKVQEWHAHLQPILAQSRDRHHFDVFELGTEIMNQFDRHGINNKIISLNHVMEKKDNSLISRYFLSTLLLANQGNVAININNRSSELPSELNDVELRLISTTRNIVSLEDNIGLRTPQISIERVVQESILPNIRTLKPVPTASITEDRDSGISMSDGCSI